MNEKELMQNSLRYQMSMGFLNGLLNDGILKKMSLMLQLNMLLTVMTLKL